MLGGSLLNVVKLEHNQYDNIYVTSDIHGQFEHFNKLINKVKLTKNDLLIIAGDSCDRGKHSCQIYEKILYLIDEGFHIIHLMGNHELMFIDAMNNSMEKSLWYRNGGKNTELFYKGKEDLLKKHIKWIENMPVVVEIGDFIIVHAGVNPEKDMKDQSQLDLLWIREEFISKSITSIDKTIIFGHTPTASRRITFYKNNTIGIDCECVRTNTLGVLELKTLKSIYIR